MRWSAGRSYHRPNPQKANVGALPCAAQAGRILFVFLQLALAPGK